VTLAILRTEDVVASISILFHAPSYEQSTSGNVGDKPLALALVDLAADAIKNRKFSPSKAPILIPSRDVVAKQSDVMSTLAFGDMSPEERGDQQRRLRAQRGQADVYAWVSVELRSNGDVLVSYDSGMEPTQFVLDMLRDARAAIEKRNFVPDPAQLEAARLRRVK